MIEVALGDRSYAVHVEAGGLSRAGELLGLERYSRLAVVTEPGPAGPHGAALEAGLAGLPVTWVRLASSGEGLKTPAQLTALWERLLDAGLDRGGAVLAFGGGVIGDLAGFAAATLLRGVDVFQLPTTLLAMVDASIGGKTGINLPRGKNLVGAFHQPTGVLADTDVLETLPSREVVGGWAEAIKTALVADPELLGLIERVGVPALPEGADRRELVARCAAAKARVVADDERETDAGVGRKALNLGHTVGHALEAVTGYAHFVHGEAVALGLRVALALSVSRRGLDAAEAARVLAVLDRMPVPEMPASVTVDAVVAATWADKKRRADVIDWVLLERPGVPVIDHVPEDAVRAAVAELLAR